jgi:tetratricopeptide (TPR) repeat protein
VLEEILKTNPDHVEAGIELAEMLSPQKQPDRVIAVLEPLLKYKHDYPLYHLLGEAHYQKERLDQARHYFEEAIKLNAQSADDHYQLGNIYLAQKRFAKAAQVYERAGQLGTSSGAYHFKLASVYYNLHRYLGTVTTAEVRGGEPGQIKNKLYLIDRVPGGKDVFYVANPQSAIYQVARAQELGIEIFEIRFLEANIWLSAKRFEKADRVYAELEEKVKSADTGLFWFYWANTALGLDQYDKYLARLEKAIVADSKVYKPMLADAYVTVATRYQQQGNTAKYIEYLAKAVAENPLSARLHVTLADAYWLDNKRDKAVEQYKLVLELEPDHAERVKLLNRIRGQEA